ncbi:MULTISPECIES: iron ABC transporter permease [unclassified Aeromicrobium]|uniref:FecCD family ABC transporter permease n=1 Tax=unclassified Aeromicrobium TaxID=2633570 RepID=UPI00288BCBC2|nr:MULTISPECIES: iron ABC transporter permease [unclassified Aeromicrobium]
MTTLAPPSTAAAAQASRRRRGRLALATTAAALVVVLLLSIGTGPVGVPPLTVAQIVLAHVLPGEHVADWTAAQDQIVWTFRLPRVLMAVLVGASLAVVGALLQAIIRNPLADPYVLGASSGAALGAVGALALGASVPGLFVSGSAFAGAAVAGVVVYVLASRGGRIESLRLVLAGVALSYLFSAVTGWITATADHGRLPGLLFFLLGSISSASWEMLALPAAALVLGVVYALRRASHLDAAMTGDETAASLGVDMTRLRVEVLVVTAAMTGAVVAVAGGIGFVGMVVPHVCRLLVGAGHRSLLPFAALAGALLVVVVDTVARTAASPREIPLGVVTALVGAPFFLWLLRTRPVGAER